MRSEPHVAKIEAAKRALLQVLEQVPDNAQVGVLALNSRVADGSPWIIPLGPVNRNAVRQAIARIGAAGGTPLGAAMKEAADALLAQREKQLYGDYRLLIVTDGEAQDEYLVDQYLPEILRRQITVDVIGVAMAQNHSLATRVDRYRRADDPASLRTAIQESLAETPLDSQDPDASADFELLAALPEEIAVAAIAALTQTDNQPIGQEAAVAAETPSNGSASPPPPPASTGVSKVLIFGIMLLLIVLLKSALHVGRRRRY